MKESSFMEIIDRLIKSGLTETQALYLVTLFLQEKNDEMKEEVVLKMKFTN